MDLIEVGLSHLFLPCHLKDQRGYLLSLVVEEAGLYRAQVTLAINGAKKTCCGPRHPSRSQAVSDLQRSQADYLDSYQMHWLKTLAQDFL